MQSCIFSIITPVFCILQSSKCCNVNVFQNFWLVLYNIYYTNFELSESFILNELSDSLFLND